MSVLPADVTAEVPATPEFVQVLRNIAAGVASRLDMPIDQIEELRLAVTEGATLLLDETGSTLLRLALHREDRSIEVVLSSDGVAEPWPSGHALASWPWVVLRGLTDEVRLDRDSGGAPAVVFTKRSERVGL